MCSKHFICFNFLFDNLKAFMSILGIIFHRFIDLFDK